MNGYRPNGDEYCDPLEQYEGLPYYGYMQTDPDCKSYTLSPIVSGAKPVPESVVPLLGLHKRKGQRLIQKEQEKALEQAAVHDAAVKEKAKEQERLERQRKLAAKEKRLSAATVYQAPLPKAYQIPGHVRRAPPPPPPRTGHKTE